MILGSAGAFFFIPKINKVFTSDNRLNSNKIRISQYKTALKVFQDNPLTIVNFFLWNTGKHR
jgi:hypothetical protein